MQNKALGASTPGNTQPLVKIPKALTQSAAWVPPATFEDGACPQCEFNLRGRHCIAPTNALGRLQGLHPELVPCEESTCGSAEGRGHGGELSGGELGGGEVGGGELGGRTFSMCYSLEGQLRHHGGILASGNERALPHLQTFALSVQTAGQQDQERSSGGPAAWSLLRGAG